ncbi:neuronal acetylcholine receptor subunit alpha-9 [Callorhinchus milii]|uniref:neuronal acetylcholine receptor subunit alpha-9 n=1 Tax=Callorhinchus milii TaxID=7868 RepID=UPI0004572540|nr:neuronal acetylcholine receptor subunit alpha-9 [Callorhinchus milii]|eukprot:gi/632944214/ref/XP_007887377.1/ PREDICTED: neuronal acetylcholine receptor subunit alpha-9 [Callorhinchus milii]
MEAESADGRYAHLLLKTLFEDYTNALRPVEDTDRALNVTLKVTLSQIKDIDERNQILTAYLWIRQIWFDAFLTWDRDKYDGLDSIRIPSSYLWRPDIVLYNKADDQSGESMETNVVLRYDGRVTWDSPAITKSSCVVDVSYFPFDNQRCNLTFGSWTYNGNQVDIDDALDSGDLTDFVENVEWEVHGMPATKNVIIYGCCSDPYPDITYTLILKRRSSFYIFNLLLPCVMISSLAPLGFYLSADSGEKVSLGVTVLLALTVFQLMVAESMPPSDSVPLIGKYYIATMTMITASTALTIIIMNIHHCGPDAKPVPKWAKVIILQYMSKMFFVYEIGENCTMSQKKEEKRDYKMQINNSKTNAKFRKEQEMRIKAQFSKEYHSNTMTLKEEESRSVIPLQRCPVCNQKESNGQSNRGAADSYASEEDVDLTPCICSFHQGRVAKNIEFIANCFREQKATNAKSAEWKKVAKVIDRFFMWIFFVMVFFMSFLIIGKAT